MMPPPGYSLVNLEYFSGVELGKRRVDLVLGIHNALNTAYRDYMNAFRYFALDRGRNISVKIKFPL
jgi:iron complex outermembrane receptor protein